MKLQQIELLTGGPRPVKISLVISVSLHLNKQIYRYRSTENPGVFGEGHIQYPQRINV